MRYCSSPRNLSYSRLSLTHLPSTFPSFPSLSPFYSFTISLFNPCLSPLKQLSPLPLTSPFPLFQFLLPLTPSFPHQPMSLSPQPIPFSLNLLPLPSSPPSTSTLSPLHILPQLPPSSPSSPRSNTPPSPSPLLISTAGVVEIHTVYRSLSHT